MGLCVVQEDCTVLTTTIPTINAASTLRCWHGLQNPKTLATAGKLALLPEAGTALRRRETPLATRVAWGAAFVLVAATAAGAFADRTDRLVPPGWVPCTAGGNSVRPA